MRKRFGAASRRFLESKKWFAIEDSRAEFRNCRWIEEVGAHTHANIPMGAVVGDSKAILHQCHLILKNELDVKNISAAITAGIGGEIVMTETLVSGFHRAISAKDSYSRAVLDCCQLLNCWIAISSLMNSNVTVSDCELATEAVLELQLNEEDLTELGLKSPFRGVVGPPNRSWYFSAPQGPLGAPRWLVE